MFMKSMPPNGPDCGNPQRRGLARGAVAAHAVERPAAEQRALLVGERAVERRRAREARAHRARVEAVEAAEIARRGRIVVGTAGAVVDHAVAVAVERRLRIVREPVQRRDRKRDQRAVDARRSSGSCARSACSGPWSGRRDRPRTPTRTPRDRHVRAAQVVAAREEGPRARAGVERRGDPDRREARPREQLLVRRLELERVGRRDERGRVERVGVGEAGRAARAQAVGVAADAAADRRAAVERPPPPGSASVPEPASAYGFCAVVTE